jgi:CRISPR-associated protein Csb1
MSATSAAVPALTLAALRDAVAGGAVAIRQRATLQPAGGPGDKVFPPTHLADKAPTKYCLEERVIDGRRLPCVLLDSVQSQANRMEVALRQAWEDGEADFPVIGVDFRGEAKVADLGLLTTLDAPHRIADALLRDAITDEDGKTKRFRETRLGQAFQDARVTNATALYLSCPTALVFGVWDSTGPRGGLGTKFPRAIVSEVIGVDVEVGNKSQSRLDPANIANSVQLFATDEAALKADSAALEWTLEPGEAARDKTKPKPFSRASDGKAGTPAAANHGNIPPTIDRVAGGVTMAHASQVGVLSLIALRRLRFPTAADGSPLPREAQRAAELAARTALAALALAGQALMREQGLDLRSRCLLVETGDSVIELLGREGGQTALRLSGEDALALLREAAAAAAAAGLPWDREPMRLRPAPRLAALIAKSRELGAAAEPQQG